MNIERIAENLVSRLGGRKGLAIAGVAAVSLGVLAVPAFASTQNAGSLLAVEVAEVETSATEPQLETAVTAPELETSVAESQADPVMADVEEVGETVPVPAPAVDTSAAVPQATTVTSTHRPAAKAKTLQDPAPQIPPTLDLWSYSFNWNSAKLPVAEQTPAPAATTPPVSATPPKSTIPAQQTVSAPESPVDPPKSEPDTPVAPPQNAPFAVSGYVSYDEMYHHPVDGLPRQVRFEYPLATNSLQELCEKFIEASQALGWSSWEEGCTGVNDVEHFQFVVTREDWGGTPNPWQAHIQGWIDNDQGTIGVYVDLRKILPPPDESDVPFIVPNFIGYQGNIQELFDGLAGYYRFFYVTYEDGEGLCQAYLDAAEVAGWTTSEVVCDGSIEDQYFKISRETEIGQVSFQLNDDDVAAILTTFPMPVIDSLPMTGVVATE